MTEVSLHFCGNMDYLKKMFAVGYLQKMLLLLAVQIVFLTARWYFVVFGDVEEGIELFSRWRFSIGEEPGMISVLNIVHHLIVTVILANQLHQNLGQNRAELILRNGMMTSLLKEFFLLELEVVVVEICVNGFAIAMSWCFRTGLYSPKLDIYLPMQFLFLGVMIIHILIMELMLCHMSGEAANVILAFCLSLEFGAAYGGIRWSPIYASSYEFCINCKTNGSIWTAAGMNVILIEVFICFILWLLIRIGSDIL